LGLLLLAGAPGLRAASPDDAWDDRFALAVLEGSQARAIAVQGTNVYFGGTFTTVGGSTAVGSGISASNIALWNGRSWSALGGGVNGPVYAIAINGNNVYVGGQFTEAGGVSAHNVARWDGTNWSAVGTGTDDRVYSLVFHGGILYAGGLFATAGGSPANLVASWNGTVWSPIGNGLGDIGAVRAIAFVGNEMFACGSFHFGSGVNEVLNIAKWESGQWQPLPGELGNTADTAYGMAVVGSDLYVGGTFLSAGGVSAKRIARWNGSWSAVGEGITAASLGLFALLADGTNLYAAGQFATAGGISTPGIARWDGVSWSALGTGTSASGFVNAVGKSGTDVYVGGAFLGAGGLQTSSTARWDGSRWWALGQGMDNAVFGLLSTTTNLYAIGRFWYAGGVGTGNLASWDGSRWSPVGGAFLQSQVLALAAGPTNLYIGGDFVSIPTNTSAVSAPAIARWNGSTWSGLGAGIRSIGAVVRAIAVAPDGTVFAGGSFTLAGGAAATNIARYYTNWQTLGTAPNSGVNGEVQALALLGNDLYVGGAFDTAGGLGASGIARWSSGAWSAVGTGFTGTVMTLTVNGADLYVGGAFTNAAAGATNLAKWNGSSWSALGDPIGGTSNDFVASISVVGNDVYVGGHFTNAGGILANHIARWNGSAWSALGSGVAPGTALNPPVVRALAFNDGRLNVGGSFASAGGKPAYGFSIWQTPPSGLPPVGSTLLPTGQLVLSWSSTPNVSYQMLSTTDLLLPFAPYGAPILATGDTANFTNSTTADPHRFFRIVLPP